MFNPIESEIFVFKKLLIVFETVFGKIYILRKANL